MFDLKVNKIMPRYYVFHKVYLRTFSVVSCLCLQGHLIAGRDSDGGIESVAGVMHLLICPSDKHIPGHVQCARHRKQIHVYHCLPSRSL